MVDLVTLQLPEGRMGVSLLSQEISNMTRGNSLEWHQGRFKLDLRKNFFPTEGFYQALNGLQWSHQPWRGLKDV